MEAFKWIPWKRFVLKIYDDIAKKETIVGRYPFRKCDMKE